MLTVTRLLEREHSASWGLAALWAHGDHKDTGLAGPQPQPASGLEKHAETGTGCLFGQSSFLSELRLLTRSSANESGLL